VDTRSDTPFSLRLLTPPPTVQHRTCNVRTGNGLLCFEATVAELDVQPSKKLPYTIRFRVYQDGGGAQPSKFSASGSARYWRIIQLHIRCRRTVTFDSSICYYISGCSCSTCTHQ